MSVTIIVDPGTTGGLGDGPAFDVPERLVADRRDPDRLPPARCDRVAHPTR
jgi:hypothetical protein